MKSWWPLAALCALASTHAFAQTKSLNLRFPSNGPQEVRSISSTPPRVSRLQQAEPIGPGQPIAPDQPVAAVHPPLELEELEALALANNPSLSRAVARVEAARGQWVQSGLPPNPTAGYLGTEIGNEHRAGQQGAFMSQEIVMGGKLRLNRAVVSQDIVRAEQLLAAQRLRVLNDVRIHFYDALVAQQQLQLSEELLKIGQRGVTTVQRLLDAQEVSPLDLLQAKVEANIAKMSAASARNDLSAARQRLAAVIGVQSLPPLPLQGDLDVQPAIVPYEEAERRLLGSSPEMAAAQAAVSRAAMVIDRARAEPLPNFDLQFSVQHDNATSDDVAGAQIGFPVPLLNRNQGQIRRANAELSAARSDARRVELQLRHRLASAYQRYANAKQQVETYRRDVLPDVQKSLELVTRVYRAGEQGYLALLTTQRTYFQTNLAYLSDLRQLRRATVELDGLLLTGSLNRDDSELMPFGIEPRE